MEKPAIEAIETVETDSNGDDCLTCAGKPYC